MGGRRQLNDINDDDDGEITPTPLKSPRALFTHVTPSLNSEGRDKSTLEKHDLAPISPWLLSTPLANLRMRCGTQEYLCGSKFLGTRSSSTKHETKIAPIALND